MSPIGPRSSGNVEPHIQACDSLGAVAVVKAAGGVVNDLLVDDSLGVGAPIAACVPAPYPALAKLMNVTPSGVS